MGLAVGAGLFWERLNQDFAAGIFAQPLSAGDRLKKRNGAFSLEHQRHLYSTGDADWPAMILGDRYGNEGVDQDVFLAEPPQQLRSPVPDGIKACGFDALLEHRKPDIAIRAHPDGAAQFRRVINRHRDEVVRSYRLGWKIGADFRCGNRAIRRWLLLLRKTAALQR